CDFAHAHRFGMTAKGVRIAYGVILATLAGCANLAPLLSPLTPASTLQASTAPPALSAATQPASTASAPHLLRVWLPPRFDPNANTAAGRLLKQRLTDFQAERPKLNIEVRIKAEDGE